MGRQIIDIERTTTADADAVWGLLGDSATWPSWTAIDEHVPVEPGGPDGTGEIRVFKTGRYTVREEIVERRAPERLSYALLSGLPLRDYRADIDLQPLPGGGTRIHWHTEFDPKVPGTGWAFRRGLDQRTAQFVEGLARAAAAPQAA